MTLLRDILAAKGSAVFTISPHATLQEAAQILLKYRVGALLVFESEGERAAQRMLGILSERDLLWSCATSPGTLDQVKVSAVMSSPVITGTPDDRIDHVMGLMTRERKRHLPVLCDGQLLGMISIGDLVKWQHDQMAIENRFMKDYISG
jgi:CBS domain-containing protein